MAVFLETQHCHIAGSSFGNTAVFHGSLSLTWKYHRLSPYDSKLKIVVISHDSLWEHSSQLALVIWHGSINVT